MDYYRNETRVQSCQPSVWAYNINSEKYLDGLWKNIPGNHSLYDHELQYHIIQNLPMKSLRSTNFHCCSWHVPETVHWYFQSDLEENSRGEENIYCALECVDHNLRNLCIFGIYSFAGVPVSQWTDQCCVVNNINVCLCPCMMYEL